LGIARSVMEMHGGTITAESEGRNRGAQFTITLQTIPQPVPENQPAGPADGMSTLRRDRLAVSGEEPGCGRRILLVEDDMTTLRVLARLLIAQRHMVDTANCVRDALALAHANEYDVLISDIGLPDASGLDLMRQLRSQTKLRGIALSGYGTDTDVAASLEAGFQTHLTKPIDMLLLEQAIQGAQIARARAMIF
jgi:CheY-like chemotaxis protein